MRGKGGRRLLLVVALLVTGGLYALLVPQPQRAAAQDDQAVTAAGEQLYVGVCITCHGAHLQGVPGRGPSIVGSGDAAVYFQVSTGRMPLARQGLQARRKEPYPGFDPTTEEGVRNLKALGAFVESQGGGPTVPDVIPAGDATKGAQLFRLNCSQCHNFTGRGGALLGGEYAPNLQSATPAQISTAMLSGPQAMPRFSDRQLAPEEKSDIIAYVLAVRGQSNAPGGLNLGEYGPATEGLVAFIVGLVALVGFAAWLGARS